VPKRTVLTAILLTSNGRAREYVGIGAFPQALDWQTKTCYKIQESQSMSHDRYDDATLT